MKQFFCAYCGKEAQQPNGAVNRAIRRGLPLHCNKLCSGMGRRKNKSKEQKVTEKRNYDIEYRSKNQAILKAKKKEYYQLTRDPIQEKEIRKKRMHLHIQYCQQPWYKEWKKEYDRKYLAKKHYGEYWESAVLITDLEVELEEKMSWYDRQIAKGTLNKSNQRRRDYERESSQR